MRLWPIVIAILAIFSSGWFGHSAYYAKEQISANQKAEKRFENLRSRQEQERQDLEKQIVSDRQKSEQSLRKVIAENARLKAAADVPVDIAFLVFSRLCDDPAECSVLYQSRPSEASPTTQRLITAEDIYRLLADLDQAIISHNLGLEQLKIQLNSCQK